MKTVLITGAGRGLGRALAGQFHLNGWHVIATDLLPELLAGLENSEGYTILPMDVASDASVQEAFEKIQTTAPILDLVINNAGIDRYFPLSEAPAEHFKKVFEVNVFGAYRVSQVFLPLLKKPGGGIIAIGSESLHISMPFLPYPISKRTLENYILALRQELWFTGRWATVVRCGPMRTAMVENVYHLKSEVENTTLDKVFQVFAANAPKGIGKIMDPSEAAQRILKIATSSLPKAIYRINNGVQLRMLKWMPFSLIEKAVRKKLGA
jgi:NAD(P)-dependent dehydrogenase (short-subunit alcohol dehydrogenase family)